MSTHATYNFPSGVSFYRHCDGYPEIGGAFFADFLQEHGNDSDKFAELYGDEYEQCECGSVHAHYEYFVYDDNVVEVYFRKGFKQFKNFQQFSNWCNDLPLDYIPVPVDPPAVPSLIELAAIRLHPTDFVRFRKAPLNEQIGILNRICQNVPEAVNQLRHLAYAAFAF